MRRIKLVIEYDGTDFCGWQIQPNGITVQQCIKEALEAIEGVPVTVNGAGRTDAGVHARGQVADFVTESRIPGEKYAAALNSKLPDSIRIRQSKEVGMEFNSRFSAKKKTYRYCIRAAHTHSALTCRYEHTVQGALDVEKMRLAARTLVGEHDFCPFMAAGSSIKDTVRTIYSAEIDAVGENIYFTVCGNGFLYKMVRLIVGTLIEIGKGKLPVEHIEGLIAEHGRATVAAPAKGLFLENIEYGEE